MLPKLLLGLSAAALMVACDARIGAGKERDVAAGAAAATAKQGQAEEGSFSINAPGFDMKVAIPETLASRMDVDSDSGVVYPGATLAGVHVEAGGDRAGAGESSVELRFASADPVDKIAGWYRDPARAGQFTVASAARDGGAVVIEGADAEKGDRFKVRLSPRAGGGSDGLLTLRGKS